MAMIGFASAHGSPGATALAVAVAHRLPDCTGRSAVLVEADPDGGTIAARHAMHGPSGFTALAGAARSAITEADVLRLAAPMSSGVLAFAGHPAGDQAHAALRTGAANLAPVLASMAQHDVVVDLGRLRPGSPAIPLAKACRAIVLVARPVLEQLVAAADRIETLGRLAPVRLVLVGDRPYGEAEVRRVLGVDQLTIVADDPVAVAADPAAAGRRRSAWRRSVGQVTAELAHLLADDESAADGADADDETVADGADGELDRSVLRWAVRT